MAGNLKTTSQCDTVLGFVEAKDFSVEANSTRCRLTKLGESMLISLTRLTIVKSLTWKKSFSPFKMYYVFLHYSFVFKGFWIQINC